jgi:predicted AAA+ superfamily ATPase
MDEFYKLWMAGLQRFMDRHIYDPSGKSYPARDDFNVLSARLERLLSGKLSENEKISILTGLRGTGKSTLLAQLFAAASEKKIRTLYIDAGRLILEGFNLNDFLKKWEENASFVSEQPIRKTLLLIDEVHYDENWGLFLKSMFDRNKANSDLMIVATGSSALKIKINPDLGRRAVFTEILPLHFREFVRIFGTSTDKTAPDTSFILSSGDAKSVFKKALDMLPEVNRYYSSLPPKAVENYLSFGGLPVFKHINEPLLMNNAIKSIVESVIARDITAMKGYKAQALSRLYSLACLIAESEKITLEKLSDSLKLKDNRTLYGLIDGFVMSGLLFPVKSYGRRHHQTRKAPKLLFSHPLFREALLEGAVPGRVAGRKYEEVLAASFRRCFVGSFGAEIYFDSAEGSADYIIKRPDKTKITIEVSASKEETSQIPSTMKKSASTYGLLLGSKEISLVENNIVKLPIKYLLLA